jgi:hypothetical protein
MSDRAAITIALPGLSDADLAQIMAAAGRVPLAQRGEFLRVVVGMLAGARPAQGDVRLAVALAQARQRRGGSA